MLVLNNENPGSLIKRGVEISLQSCSVRTWSFAEHRCVSSAKVRVRPRRCCVCPQRGHALQLEAGWAHLQNLGKCHCRSFLDAEQLHAWTVWAGFWCWIYVGWEAQVSSGSALVSTSRRMLHRAWGMGLGAVLQETCPLPPHSTPRRGQITLHLVLMKL